MQGKDVAPGKKIQLEVHANDAAALRAKGTEFFAAIQGKIVMPQGMVVYDNVPLMVTATKPKGPVEVVQKTSIKMSITDKPMLISCPACGQSHGMPDQVCMGCGAKLPVMSI